MRRGRVAPVILLGKRIFLVELANPATPHARFLTYATRADHTLSRKPRPSPRHMSAILCGLVRDLLRPVICLP